MGGREDRKGGRGSVLASGGGRYVCRQASEQVRQQVRRD